VDKHVVFLADGTWNSPDQDQDEDGSPDYTNVYKMFLALDGADPAGALKSAREQEKEARLDGVAQIAKYIHGVGDSSNPIRHIVGGAFGAGIIARVVRGYTFISRNYEPGAHVHIVGFSRGAYTARALAGMIVSQGLLGAHITRDKELAYRCGTEAWYRYRANSPNRPNIFVRAAEALANPRELFRRDVLKDSDLLPISRIAAVGVWDTVGAMGLPNYRNDARLDRFKFANTRLSEKVTNGFHALALDEQRVDFTPTFWDRASNVTQVLFPGAHADVGGGYPNNPQESGLSNVALRWMIEQLKGAGVRFVDADVNALVPDPTATAHKPWAHGPWPKLPHRSRTFPEGIIEHPSVAERVRAVGVIAEPGEAAAPYRPANRPANPN
jgi:uncharacterized protein (DUF2235 family)